jgi:hypothetical protein
VQPVASRYTDCAIPAHIIQGVHRGFLSMQASRSGYALTYVIILNRPAGSRD